MDPTYTVSITSSDTVFTDLNFYADSNSVYIDEAVAVISIPSVSFRAKVYPNPFEKHSALELVPDEPEDGKIEILNLLGGHAGLIHKGRMNPGKHGFDVGYSMSDAGIYLLRITTGKETQVVKIVKQ